MFKQFTNGLASTFKEELEEALDDLNVNTNTVNQTLNTEKTRLDSRIDTIITSNPQPSEVVDARGGFPVLSGHLDNINEQLAENETKQIYEGIDIKVPFIEGLVGAKGDGVTDDTLVIQNIINYAKNNGIKKIKIPIGNFKVTSRLIVPDTLDIEGAHRIYSVFLCEHNQAVLDFDLSVSSRTTQSGSCNISNFTIKRSNITTTYTAGNYGIKFPCTYGATIVQNVDVHNMGDSAIYLLADLESGTGPTRFKDCRMSQNNGWIIEMEGTIADIYIDNVNGYNNRGGLKFDSTKKTATSPAQNVVISNLDIEHTGGKDAAEFTNPLNAIYAKGIAGVHISGAVIQTATQTTQKLVHVIYLDNCKYATLADGNEITNRMGTEAYGLYANGCQNLYIGNNDFSSSSLGGGIKLESCTRARIMQPMFSSTGTHDLNLISSSVFIISDNVFGHVKTDYTGSIVSLASANIDSNFLSKSKAETITAEYTVQKSYARSHWKDTGTTEKRKLSLENGNNMVRFQVKNDSDVFEWEALQFNLNTKTISSSQGGGTMSTLVNVRTGSGTPSITPDFIGQDYIDTTNKVGYKACGSTSSDWKQTTV